EPLASEEGRAMGNRTSSLIVFGLLAVFGGQARAQGVVPGGWAAGFGYQSVGELAGGGGSSGFGYGIYGLPGVGYAPIGAAAPGLTFNPSGGLGEFAAPPLTANGMGSLIK